MSEPFLAEIKVWAGNFAPRGWALCNGQLLPIVQNTALFALIGTYYGGDGRTTFALPNLQGCSPLMHGQGPGLSNYQVGQTGGSEAVSLLQSEIPVHTHQLVAATDSVDSPSPIDAMPGTAPRGNLYRTPSNSTMAPQALGLAGNGLPHNNRQPYLVLNFIIALQGIFPPRS